MSKRRRLTPEFKARVALALLAGAHTQAELCKQHRVSPQQVKHWRQQLEANAHRVFGSGDEQELKGRIAELERMVGRLTMQVEILRKASTLLDVPPPGEGRWPVPRMRDAQATPWPWSARPSAATEAPSTIAPSRRTTPH